MMMKTILFNLYLSIAIVFSVLWWGLLLGIGTENETYQIVVTVGAATFGFGFIIPIFLPFVAGSYIISKHREKRRSGT